MYVIKSDYKNRISTDLLDKIIQEGAENGDDILAHASKTAEDTISSRAGVLYDINPEFAKTTTDRNFLVLMWALNIAIYIIYQRIDDEEVPEKVVKNYDDTMDELADISKGKSSINLPPKPADEDEGTGAGDEQASTSGTGLRRFGSAAKRSHRP